MSDKKRPGAGYTSPKPPRNDPAESALETASQAQREAFFWKKFFEDTRLRKWIVLSGLGAAVGASLEIIRLAWLALRYIKGF
jgi:hypothetical protein